MSKAPRKARGSYISQIGSVYYFRYLLPESMSHLFGQTTIKKSLNIRHVRQAKKVAAHLVSACNEVFKYFISEGVIVDQAQAKAILFQYLEDKLKSWTVYHAERPVLSDEQLKIDILQIKSQIAAMQTKLAKSDFLDVIPEAHSLMTQHRVEEKDYNLKEVCYNITKMNKTFYEILDRRLMGNFIYEENVLNRLRPNESVQNVVYVQEPMEQKKTSPKLSILIEKYIDECKSEWSGNTFIEYTRIYRNTFLQNVEDVPANLFSLEEFLELRKKLSEREGLDGKPISKARLEIINKRIKTFFNWCIERDYMTVNFASKVKIRKSARRTSENMRPFESDDIRLIFSQKQFAEPKKKSPQHFWVPIIAYYTGMRLGEIVQLEKRDIIHNEERGYWLIDINENGEKFTKNDYSIRTIPIHQDLIDIGLGKFVNASKEGRLFPISSKYPSKVFGSAFSKFKTSIGFDRYKTFHSFRRTFSNILKQLMINDILSDEYTGHTNSSMTKGTYSNRFDKDVFWNELVNKLEFEVRLTDLSWSNSKAVIPRKKSVKRK